MAPATRHAVRVLPPSGPSSMGRMEPALAPPDPPSRGGAHRSVWPLLLLGPLLAVGLLLVAPERGAAAAPGQTLPPAADLAVALAPPAEPLVVGAPLTYTLTITNLGPGAALSATAELSVSGAMLVVAAGPGGSCTAAGAATQCVLGELAAHSHVTMPLGLETALPGWVAVTATVATASPESELANNRVTAQAAVGWVWAEHQLWLPWASNPPGAQPEQGLPPGPYAAPARGRLSLDP